MKKFLWTLAALMMVGAASVLMTSCGDDEETVTTDDNPEQTDPSTGNDDPIPSGGSDTHEYVDLGLPSGTLWATCNVGTEHPEDHGDHFAWGETEPKNDYSWSTYKWCNGSETTITKYCDNSSYGIVDNKTELELEDDAASINWGTDWRMPSIEQLEELHAECTWTWTQLNGVNGYNIVGPNGNRLFLPAEGYYGYYWSRTLSPNFHAYYLHFGSVSVWWDTAFRYTGKIIRPVRMSQ